MSRLDRETIVVEKDGVTARLPLSMYAAECLGNGIALRRNLRDWYYQQAQNRGFATGHSVMLAIDVDASRFFVQIPMAASAGEIVSNVQLRDGRSFEPISSDMAEALQDNPRFMTVCELACAIGREIMLNSPFAKPNDADWMSSRDALEQSHAPMDGLLARLSEAGMVEEPGRIRAGTDSMDDAKPIDDIMFQLAAAIRDPEVCRSSVSALRRAFADIFAGPPAIGDLREEHVDLLCDAFAHRLALDGQDTEAAFGMAIIPFFRSMSSKYDTILARSAMGIDLLTDKGCERIAALMRLDLESITRRAGESARLSSNVRDHIGASLDNMIADTAPESRFTIAGKAPKAGYFFSGTRNPEAPSIYLRGVAKALMTFGGVAGPQNAAAMLLSEAYGSAADPLWEKEGRTPGLSDLAPMHAIVAQRPRITPVVNRPAPSPSP